MGGIVANNGARVAVDYSIYGSLSVLFDAVAILVSTKEAARLLAWIRINRFANQEPLRFF